MSSSSLTCCGKEKINGICQVCGDLTPCAWCKGVIQPNGDSLPIPYKETGNFSHGICSSCYEVEELYTLNLIKVERPSFFIKTI